MIWPDEALFSSPAANLAENGSFSTPVLYGLIPGMDRATLWNSPLFMVFLSGVYFFTGENLLWARTLSLVFAFFALYYFLRNLELIISERIMLLFIPLILVFDLTFQRSANTARMDMLTLLFFLMTHQQLLLAFMENNPALDKKRFFLAGIFTGLAGLSHPFAVILIGVHAVYAFPDYKKFLISILGTAASFSLWLFYIIPNFNLFLLQFSLQIQRKPNLFSLWGGDTGGIFKVFFSQYGGSFALMISGFLIFLAIAALILYHIKDLKNNFLKDPFFRILSAFILITGFALISSEGWYVLYCGPFFLLVLAYLSSRAKIDMNKIYNLKPSFIRNDLSLVLLSVFFIFSSVYYTGKHHFIKKTPAVSKSFLQATVPLISKCSSIYLRVRPDPYFHLRKQKPKIEVLEFIPGKLMIEKDQKDLFRRLDKIECFFLDANDSWEPNISNYISANRYDFERIHIYYADPVGKNTLYRRIIR
ncbi:MAG: hypothetical protein OEZ34_03640 [Spirochaetia bacterium]|nr:hypothetical protein [Spirochaetia bacterium]